MNENFFIQLGKNLARQDQAIKGLAAAVKSDSKSIGILSVCILGLCWVEYRNMKYADHLRKRVSALEAEKREGFDVLK